MKLIKGMLGWHSNKQIFKTDFYKLSGKNFKSFGLALTNYPNKFPPFINLDCPFFFQEHINTCGDSCIKMLISFQLLHFKQNPEFCAGLKPINYFLSKKRGAFLGMSEDDFKKIGLQSIDFPEEFRNSKKMFCSWIAYSLYHLGPLIITINIFKGQVGHSVIIKGVENETFLLHDPWNGPDQFVHYNNFFKILDKCSEKITYFPNRYLNKIYPQRENTIRNNLLFFYDNPKPIPLLRNIDIIKPILL